MSGHSIFYYPYASLTKQHSLLLKVVALYFDKLYILDPEKASFDSIGVREMGADLQLLEQAGLLERIAPEAVLHQHEKAILDAIQSDLADPKFKTLCAEKGNKRWTLALVKVPKDRRGNPSFKPLDDSMKQVMTGYSEVYDEYRESRGTPTEYRYADYPFDVGKAIMLNKINMSSDLNILHFGRTSNERKAFQRPDYALGRVSFG
jgi:hypothetical protein